MMLAPLAHIISASFGSGHLFQFVLASAMSTAISRKRKACDMLSLNEFVYEAEGSYKFRKLLPDIRIQAWWHHSYTSFAYNWSTWWTWAAAAETSSDEEMQC